MDRCRLARRSGQRAACRRQRRSSNLRAERRSSDAAAVERRCRGAADIAELACRADFRRRRSGRRLLIYSGRRRERRVPIPAAFARDRSRAVESAGRLARGRCADFAGRADRRGVCHGSSRRRRSRPAPALVGQDRLGGPRLDTWSSRRGFRPCNRPGAHSLSAARRGRTIAARDVSHDLARVGDDPVQQRQTRRQRHAVGQRSSDDEHGGRSHCLRERTGRFQRSAGSPRSTGRSSSSTSGR